MAQKTPAPTLGIPLHFPPCHSCGNRTAADIVPPPRRRASPAKRLFRRGLLSPLHFVTLRSQTPHQRLKGGGAAPGPWPGAVRYKKTQTSRFAFFSVSWRRPAAPPPNCRMKAYPTFRSAAFSAMSRQTFNNCCESNNLTDWRRPPGDEAKDPHTAAYPAIGE
jgi:hypothetical protein